MDFNTEKLKRKMFGSKKKEDWASRDSWIRRAIYWKLMALGVFGEGEETQEIMNKAFMNAINSDLFRSPNENEILFMEKLCVKRYNDKYKKKAESV